MPADDDSQPAKKPRAKRSALEFPAAFAEALIDWFQREGRSYPWRETRDPYAVLVSEIMLQQTRIGTVLEGGYYDRWMARFPTLAALAQASEDEVLKAWEGLGYYRRARQLQALAKECIGQWEGQIPREFDALLGLPGVGRYTAGAVYSFAFAKSAPIVDGNVARVFARLLDYQGVVDAPAGQRQLWDWAEALLPAKEVRAYNSGLMELGQRLCLKQRPLCRTCPVADFCQTRAPENLPAKAARRETVFLEEHAVLHLRNGTILLARETGSRRRGMWQLPLREPKELAKAPLLYRAPYSITHHRVMLHVHDGAALPAQPRLEEAWHPLDGLAGLAMPAPFRKAVERLLGERDFRLE